MRGPVVGTVGLLVLMAWGGPLGAQEAPETQACMDCHGVEGTRPAGEAADGVSFYLGDWENSVHGMLECTDCHDSVLELPHDTPLTPPDCSSCHPEETELYEQSAHCSLCEAGDSMAPSCADCHDPHSVRDASDPESVLHRTRLAALCTRCHGDENGAGSRVTAVPHPAQSYARGAHARAMQAGNERAATCEDCHDSHAVRGANDQNSPIYFSNIPETCGACHEAEYEAYHASVHSIGVEQGATGSPVCNTCHGEHAVLDLGEPGQSTVISSETCESCHNSPALARRYDLPQGAVASYEDSYHGRAARGGLASAAGCTSCHGVHRILASSNPESSIHPDQLVATCKRCHRQATEEFATTYAHAPRDLSAADRGTLLVRRIYAWLIGFVIGGMLLHNALLFAHDLRERWARHKAHATHQRLNRNELRQHAALLTTFLLLVITGFALKYSHTFWASGLEAIGMDEAVRRILHRVAAVGMVVASVYHLFYMLTSRGREQMGHMAPRMRDLREFGANMAYHLGRTSRRPSFTRFRYIEKAEYWALVWGTIVMVATGFILWFPDRLAGPSWLVRVAEAVHLYEAWLAFLAIVVWHFFFVMLRPGTFPVSFTVFTGRMEPEELEHEHPEEYRRTYARRLRRPPPGGAESSTAEAGTAAAAPSAASSAHGGSSNRASTPESSGEPGAAGTNGDHAETPLPESESNEGRKT